ncbi:MAG: hypothetical protein EPN19_02435 [Betaproteobacteria bacterium]|nr:MAG: hypothetical protein EPN19_02435 [Betaproteobacteria bacterium]
MLDPAMRFPYAHASHADWSQTLALCLAELDAQSKLPGCAREPNLGFAYLTEALQPHAAAIVARLKAHTGIEHWIGASGVGICATATEYPEGPALAVMLGRFQPGSFSVFSGVQRPPALGVRTASGASAAYTALVHADPYTPELAGLIVDMAGKVETNYLFGGLACGEGSCTLIADRALEGGLSGVVFAGDVSLVSRVSQGCYPFAAERLVTRSEGSVIFELDGEQAFDVLLRDAKIPERVRHGGPNELRAALNPLARRGLFIGITPSESGAYRERTPVSDYVVRHVVAVDPGEGSVSIAAPIEDGARVAFCSRDEAAARKDLVRICTQIREHLDERGEAGGAPLEAKGAVYVSCNGRGRHLFGRPGEELKIIRQRLGDVPLVGFYANGEIGGQNLYGFTGVLTVFY